MIFFPGGGSIWWLAKFPIKMRFIVEIRFEQDLFSNRLKMGNFLWMGKEVRLSPLYKIFVAACQVENQEKETICSKTGAF